MIQLLSTTPITYSIKYNMQNMAYQRVSDRQNGKNFFCPDKLEAAGETISFGTFPFSRCINHRKLKLSFEDVGGILHYQRLFGGKKFEANIASSKQEYCIMPAAPLNLPVSMTDFLQIRFNEIEVEPGTKTTIFVTAPLEVAVTLKAENEAVKTLDVFSFAKPKFALYGSATRGVLARTVVSKVSTAPHPVKNYKEFLLRLEIENTSEAWAAIGRVILYMKGLSLYYNATSVAASAKVTIVNQDTAEVTCEDILPGENMTRAESVFRLRRLDEVCNIKGVIYDNTFIMDMGLK